jgi:hypothetical protein
MIALLRSRRIRTGIRAMFGEARIEDLWKHPSRFKAVTDSSNRKVRGLWRRGEKWVMQSRVLPCGL